MATKYGTAWIDVRGDTRPLVGDITSALAKGSSVAGSLAKTVVGDVGRLGTQAAAAVTTAATITVGSLAKIGAQYNTLEQSSLAAFKTLLGTKAAAEEMQADLREFAKSSPFPRQAFIEGTQRLLAFGFEAKKVIPTLDGIQNAVAAAGGSATDLSGIVEVLAKIRSSATFNIRDLTELGNRGINAAKLIGDSMGITEQEFRDSIFGAPLRGADAIQAIDDLVAGMSKNFDGAAAGLKETWVGAIDRIKGAWRDLGSGLVDPFITKTGGGSAVDSANEIADSLRAVEKNILPVIVPLSELLGRHMLSAAQGAAEWTKAIKPTEAASKINQVIGVVDKARISLDGLESVAGGVGIAIAGIGARTVLGPLGFLVPTISPITGVLGGLVLGSKEGRAALIELGSEVKDFAGGPGRDLTEGLGRLSQELSGPTAQAIEGLGSGLLGAGRIAVPVLVDAMDRLGPPLGVLLTNGGELAENVLPEIASVISTGVAVVLPPFEAGLSLAGAAAKVLADNSWLVVPALGAIAAVKVTDGLANIASTLGSMGSGLGTAVKDLGLYYQVLRAEGGGMASSLGGALSASTGLATVLSGALNPAVWAVGGAIAAGAVIWHDWQRDVVKIKDEAKELSRVLIEQGEDVLPTLARQFSNILERSKGGEDAWRKTGMSISGVVEALNESPGAFDAAWRKMRMFDTSALAASEHLDLFPKSMRPVIENLRAMVDANQLGADEFENIIKYFKELDQESKITAQNVGMLAERFRDATKETQLSADAQRWLNTALDDNASLEARRDALMKLKTIMPEVAEANGIVVGSSQELTDKITAAALSAEEAAEMLDRYGAATESAGDASGEAADEIELTQNNVDGLAASLDEARQQANDLRDALLELAGGSRNVAVAEVAAYDAVNSALSSREDALKKVADAQQQVADKQAALNKARAEGKDVASAERDLARAQQDLAKAQDVTKVSIDRTTEAGKRVITTVDGIVSRFEDLALKENDATGEGARRRYGELLAQLEVLRDNGVIPAGEAYQELLDTFNLTPEGIDLRVRADMGEALKGLSEVQDLAANLLPGGTADAIVLEIQTLINNGEYQEAATRIQALLDEYDEMEINVNVKANDAGLETTRLKLDWTAREREALMRPDIDNRAATDTERRLNELSRDRYMKILPLYDEGVLSMADMGRITRDPVSGRRASGGPVWPGAWLVGEHGPELLQLGQSGHVFNADETRRLMDGKSQSGSQFTEAQIDRLIEAMRERSAMDITVTADNDDGRVIGERVLSEMWLRGR